MPQVQMFILIRLTQHVSGIIMPIVRRTDYVNNCMWSMPSTWKNLYYLGLCKYTFAQRRNRLSTHFSEGIPVVKRRMSVIHVYTSILKVKVWFMRWPFCLHVFSPFKVFIQLFYIWFYSFTWFLRNLLRILRHSGGCANIAVFFNSLWSIIAVWRECEFVRRNGD